LALRHCEEISLPRILIKYQSTWCPISVNKASCGRGFEEAVPFGVYPVE
jgi:hypothetical protein